ncbi:MAG TPA: Gfo/Idh/MocA family oxidoreductase, partial [Chloroflexota bacterium]|nr:Gfo/Idh/MocA family oxidoreductase [Chloroflexota bacterium]
MNEARTIGYGVVGINQRVRRTILNGIVRSPRARLAAVCSRDAAKARQTTDELGGTPYTALADLLADPGVDVVFICTPHALHRPMSLDTLRA